MSRTRFQSTPSARRATCEARVAVNAAVISIHALREEGDLPDDCRGEVAVGFQSTPSARRATDQLFTLGGVFNISIHALREEGDLPSITPC